MVVNLYTTIGASFFFAESTHLCFVFLKAAGQDLDACVFPLLVSETMPDSAITHAGVCWPEGTDVF